MKTIGLLDWDLTHHKQPIMFNLELMKLSSYYKGRRHIVKMLDKFDDSRYSKIILRKDYQDDFYPSNIFNNEKVELGGMVFSNDTYYPLLEEIELQIADLTIYEQFRKIYRDTTIGKESYHKMIHGVHFRFSKVGGDWTKQIPRERIDKIHNYFVHDEDLHNHPGASKEIHKELLKISGKFPYVGFKYPQLVLNEQDLLDWGHLHKVRHFSNLILNKIYDDECIQTSIKPGQRTECEYNLLAKDLTEENLARIFKQLIFFKMNDSKILLNIAEENLIEQELKKVIELINLYSNYVFNNRKYRYLTMFAYAKRSLKWDKEEKIQIFDFLRKNYYELFKLFYECSTVKLINKNFENWRD